MDVLTSVRHDNSVLASWPAEVLQQLVPHLKQASLAQGHVICEPGDDIDHLYFPQSGLISLLVMTRDGSTVETSVVGRDGVFGLSRGLGGRRSLTRATVQVPGVFSILRAGHFEQVAHDNAIVATLIARHLELLWAESQQLLACNAIHDAAARLCRWLLSCSDRIGNDALPLTQEFLAQMLGVRRTTVTLLAQTLQAKGWIRYRRGHIMIVERDQLVASACECYHVTRQEELPRRLGIRP